MNADVAQALMPVAAELAALATSTPPLAPATQSRNVLAHFSIFQNIGEAFDRSLEESFGAGWKVLAPDVPSQAIDPPADLRAITLRRSRLPLVAHDGVRIFPVLFLRDPLSRARALYDLERTPWQRENSQGPHTRAANELDFAGWIKWCLSQQIFAAPIANYQTRICCLTNNGLNPDDWQRPVSLGNYREAIELLSQAQVGLLEDFEGSLLRIEHALHGEFPGLQLLSHLDDVAAETNVAIEYSPGQLANELGTELYDRLCDANSYDLLLVQRFRQPSA
jgi:hypothetical protein